ncbi:MAG: AAA family ATPase [Pseudobdellovibrionaceae bacterium]
MKSKGPSQFDFAKENCQKNRRLFAQKSLLMESVARKCLSLTLAFVLSTSVGHFALADIASELSSLISQTQSQNPQDISQAAEKLANYPFQESQGALLGLIQNQINRGADGLNTFILSAAVNSLAEIGTSEVVERFNQMYSQFYHLQPGAKLNQRSKDMITSNMQTALSRMQDRVKQLPRGIEPKVAKGSEIKVKDGIRVVNVNGNEYQFFGDVVREQAKKGDDAAKIVAQTSIDFLTDSVLESIAGNDEFKIYGRDSEAKDALLTLVRMKGKNPILVGPAGVGKTTIASRLAQIITSELPAHPIYDELRGASVIETTPARISRLAKSDANSAQASAIEDFFDSVLKVEKSTKKPIVVFIDEIHTLSKAQIEAMKPYLDSNKRAIRLVGATTGKEFNMAFKQNEAIKRRMQLIDVKEFTVDQTTEIVRNTWQGQIEKRYKVQFDEKAVRSIVQNSQTLLPDNGRFDGAIKIMQDIAISENDKKLGQADLQITDKEVDSFLQKRLGFPVNPRDGRAMHEYREGLISNLSQDVLFQEPMVHSTVDLWMDLMGDNERGVRVQALLGPTGTGKSELGRSLAKRVFNREGAFLEIDANTYKTGGMALNSLIGAPNGVISSDKTSGVLMDYLDDPSKGKFGGVILINEAERMPQEAWERLMEMLDIGEVAGGDGKTRKLKRHLIILTSNRTDKVVFPSGIERLTKDEMDRHVNSFDNDKLREAYRQKSSGKDEFILPDPIIARIDKWSLAKPITLEIAKEIAAKFAKRQSEKLSERFEATIELDPKAIESIARSSFQYGMGARPVIKAVQSQLQKIVTDVLAKSSATHQKVHVKVEGTTLIAESSTSEKAQLQLPRAQGLDPLDDPAFAQKMKNLLPTLKESVIGQDEALKSIAQAVIAHQSDPGSNKRPTALFLVGSTGTGKTSTAKALAKALYNNPERAEVIDLGKVNFEGGLNDVFGSKKGYVGSQDRSLFEEILLRNPEGGVIVFDEASNMGGEDKARKNALFKQGFYSLLEEGKWTSSSTGTTYDLSKFTIIFTGNDGENLFQGLDADDLRLATYKKNQDRSKVQKILIEAGVPEAFLGRMMDVILMKPLLSTDIEQITRSMLKETLKPYEERGLKFEVDSEFYNKVSKAFFSHDQGARSIRSMLDSGFKSTIANLIVQGGGLQTLKGSTIKITLTDTQTKRPFAGPKDQERSVKLVLQIKDSSGHQSEVIENDLTSKAVKINKQSFSDSRATAIHEAGHAIANIPELTGQRLTHLTIIGTGDMGGYARYEDVQVKSQAFTMEKLVAEVALMLAGSRAQQMDGQPLDAGWEKDLKRARELISHSILEYGLVPELHGVFYREGKPHLTSAQVQIASNAVERILLEGDVKAQGILRANWQLVRQVSATLLKKGSISGTEFEAIAKSVQPSSARLPEVRREQRINAARMKCESVFTEVIQ